MSRKFVVALAFCLAAAPMHAQARTVSGIVFATGADEASIRGGGIRVVAIPRAGSGRITADSLCNIGRTGNPLDALISLGEFIGMPLSPPGVDTARVRSIQAHARSLLATFNRAVVDSTHTDSTGHYDLRRLGAGDYWIMAGGDFAGGYYQWWAPVTVGNTPIVVDMGASSFAHGAYCVPSQ